MEKYISKDALVAKLKRRIKTNKECMLGLRNLDYYQGKVDALNDTLFSLDTLEVKEVDFEEEYAKYSNDINAEYAFPIDLADYKEFAKHFFELGLKASNPITAADRGTAEEIIINLKRVEKDYRIDLTKEIEWLRSKVKKGE